MVIKHGRFGKFIACSGYPECKTTKPVTLGIACPSRCDKGQLVERRSRKGRTFFGCSAYPDCKFVRVAAAGGRAVPEVRGAVPDRARGAGRAARSAAVREGCDFSARGRDHRGMKDPLAGVPASPRGRAERLAHTLRSYRTDLVEFQRFLADRGAGGLAAADARAVRAWLAALHARGLDAGLDRPQAGRAPELAAASSFAAACCERNPAREVRGPAAAAEARVVPADRRGGRPGRARAPSAALRARATWRSSSCSTRAGCASPSSRASTSTTLDRDRAHRARARQGPQGADRALRRAGRAGARGLARAARRSTPGPLFAERARRAARRALGAHDRAARGPRGRHRPAGEPAHAAPHLRHAPARRAAPTCA